MAEAHNVVELLTQSIANQSHQHRVNPHIPVFQATLVEDGAMLFVPHPKYFATFVAKVAYRLRNKIFTMMWPLGPWVCTGIVVTFAAFVLQSSPDSQLRSGTIATWMWEVDTWFGYTKIFPVWFRIFYLNVWFAAGVLFCCLVLQRVMLRILLHYKGWMRETKGQTSVMTKAWGGLLRLLFLGKRKPLLYSFQSALPKLVVPGVRHTVDLYLQTVQPLLGSEEFEKQKALAESFMDNEAKKLQPYLHLKSYITRNYVSTWWERFVYCRSRGSLLINSNYYGLGSCEKIPSSSQIGRAATLIDLFFDLKAKIEHETLEPLTIRGTVPLCMRQYERVFNTVRIPHAEEDEVMHYENVGGKYVVVELNGIYYRLDCYDSFNNKLNAYEIQQQLQKIQDLAASTNQSSEELRNIAALTTDNRSVWAKNREAFFADGLNYQSLSTIERAAFLVHLDPSTPDDLTDQGKHCLHGTGGNRWCDKSFNLIVFANGKSGMHVEHTFADAPVIAHIWELAHAAEWKKSLRGHYEADGLVKKMDPQLPKDFKFINRCPRSIRPPQPLFWALTSDGLQAIQDSLQRARHECDDLHLRIGFHDAYSTNVIKKVFKVSPDACIQMVLQLAQYRDQQKFALTYESSMTRLFQDGRTETIRTCSAQSCEWVLAMEEGKATKEELQALFRAAAEQHVKYTRLAMTGQACDRHLFALYIVAKGTAVKSEFLETALSGAWNLSTSQLPQFQAPNEWPEEMMGDIGYRSPSGGFGPVANNGYGVSYMLADADHIFFHVSSKRSATNTDSDRFLERILTAFKDVKDIFTD